MNRIYLDNAATTQPDPRVRDAMLPFLADRFGNPGSGHSFGQEALDAVETARRDTASLFGAKPTEILFTGGGTESDNLALWGVAHALRDRGRHLIVSSVEHAAVLRCAEFLADSGWRVTRIPVDSDGLVDPRDVKKAIRPDTVLISVMQANNEVGTIQPIEKIGRIARERGVLFHTDAVQGIGCLPMDVGRVPVDLAAISGHKLHGPKGVGALFVREGTPLTPLIHGGGQEKGRRGGTHNVPGIVGLGAACASVREHRGAHVRKIRNLRDLLQTEILNRIDGIRINGHPEHRLPHVLHLSIPHVDGEALLRHLDIEGVAASAGSACAGGSGRISHVLEAMGRTGADAEGSLRLSPGKENTESEMIDAAECIEKVVKYLRSLAGY
ncbi:MAG TPA: cysteine desulfurase [bacterium]|nr:cysteine desulfurase [bacterium]